MVLKKAWEEVRAVKEVVSGGRGRKRFSAENKSHHPQEQSLDSLPDHSLDAIALDAKLSEIASMDDLDTILDNRGVFDVTDEEVKHKIADTVLKHPDIPLDYLFEQPISISDDDITEMYARSAHEMRKGVLSKARNAIDQVFANGGEMSTDASEISDTLKSAGIYGDRLQEGGIKKIQNYVTIKKKSDGLMERHITDVWEKAAETDNENDIERAVEAMQNFEQKLLDEEVRLRDNVGGVWGACQKVKGGWRRLGEKNIGSWLMTRKGWQPKNTLWGKIGDSALQALSLRTLCMGAFVPLSFLTAGMTGVAVATGIRRGVRTLIGMDSGYQFVKGWQEKNLKERVEKMDEKTDVIALKKEYDTFIKEHHSSESIDAVKKSQEYRSLQEKYYENIKDSYADTMEAEKVRMKQIESDLKSRNTVKKNKWKLFAGGTLAALAAGAVPEAVKKGIGFFGDSASPDAETLVEKNKTSSFSEKGDTREGVLRNAKHEPAAGNSEVSPPVSDTAIETEKTDTSPASNTVPETEKADSSPVSDTETETKESTPSSDDASIEIDLESYVVQSDDTIITLLEEQGVDPNKAWEKIRFLDVNEESLQENIEGYAGLSDVAKRKVREKIQGMLNKFGIDSGDINLIYAGKTVNLEAVKDFVTNDKTYTTVRDFLSEDELTDDTDLNNAERPLYNPRRSDMEREITSESEAFPKPAFSTKESVNSNAVPPAALGVDLSDLKPIDLGDDELELSTDVVDKETAVDRKAKVTPSEPEEFETSESSEVMTGTTEEGMRADEAAPSDSEVDPDTKERSEEEQAEEEEDEEEEIIDTEFSQFTGLFESVDIADEKKILKMKPGTVFKFAKEGKEYIGVRVNGESRSLSLAQRISEQRGRVALALLKSVYEDKGIDDVKEYLGDEKEYVKKVGNSLSSGPVTLTESSSKILERVREYGRQKIRGFVSAPLSNFYKADQ